MNFLKIILFFQLIEIEMSIDWHKYVISSNLQASFKSIKSLNGIESFNYITSIDLSKNQIKQIDSLHNFISLEILDLSTNQKKWIH